MKAVAFLAVLALAFVAWTLSTSTEPESGAQAAPKAEDGRPSWVDDPTGFYDETRDDLLFAVGKAPFAGNLDAALRSAEMSARASLAKQQVEERLKGEKPEGPIDEVIVGSKRVAQWRSPKDEVFVLMIQPR